MTKSDIPPDAITVKGVHRIMTEASATGDVSRQRVRDRMSARAFRDAVQEHKLADGARVYSEADVRAYVDKAKDGWSAGK